MAQLNIEIPLNRKDIILKCHGYQFVTLWMWQTSFTSCYGERTWQHDKVYMCGGSFYENRRSFRKSRDSLRKLIVHIIDLGFRWLRWLGVNPSISLFWVRILIRHGCLRSSKRLIRCHRLINQINAKEENVMSFISLRTVVSVGTVGT